MYITKIGNGTYGTEPGIICKKKSIKVNAGKYPSIVYLNDRLIVKYS